MPQLIMRYTLRSAAGDLTGTLDELRQSLWSLQDQYEQRVRESKRLDAMGGDLHEASYRARLISEIAELMEARSA